MNFVKEIPRQTARSPKITDDYFDKEALEIINAGKLYGIDLHYPVVNCISRKDNEIIKDVFQRYKDDYVKLVAHLEKLNYKVSIERIVLDEHGWYDSLIIKF